MKKICLVLLMVFGVSFFAIGEITVKNEATAFYSYGVADIDQMLPDTFMGVYDETKNGLYLNGKIEMTGGFQNRYDYVLQLSSTNQTGGSYLGLQTGASNPADSPVLNLDSVWVRFYLSRIFAPNLNIAGAETRVNVKTGKFGVSALDASISGYGLESVQNMIRTPGSYAVSLESIVLFPGSSQIVRGQRSNVSFEVTTSGKLDEAVQRLYDTDGGVSNHGRPVLGEFAPQILARLALNNYALPFGILSAGASYAYNGAGIYSGHSAGASVALALDIIPDTLVMPIGLSGAFYEKNIDTLAGFTGSTSGRDTTDFRQTIRAGYGLGLQYLQAGLIGDPRVVGEVTLSGSYSNINHIYRDPINVLNLGLDGQYFVLPNLYLGGGFMLGTLTNVTWQTGAEVSSAFDDFNRVYTLQENFGYEAYLGFDVMSNLRMSIGFANYKGLSMNKGLESIQSGLVKVRQSGTSVSDMLWETRGVFIMTNIRL